MQWQWTVVGVTLQKALIKAYVALNRMLVEFECEEASGEGQKKVRKIRLNAGGKGIFVMQWQYNSNTITCNMYALGNVFNDGGTKEN